MASPISLCRTDGLFGASIRSGPTMSEIPNWRLFVGFGYENPKIEIFGGVDMNLSSHSNGLKNDRGEDLLLNLSGVSLDFGYKFSKLSKRLTLTLGSAFSWRTISYQAGSSSSFFFPELFNNQSQSPLGVATHIGFQPYFQGDYRIADWFAVILRLGYDQNVGPDYQDITSSTVSGPYAQLGLKIEFSPNDKPEYDPW